ncbi:hypothetical protein EDD17DRAFT_846712 [Pisolithus thermaeus]|nr:hypothetical protein EV401DRAFT_918931 [Pisolithus croceorrhizus]KAI6160062.1 hypothetical protein EDD17DRAFT_846712 [Pisolithus thermaeus]
MDNSKNQSPCLVAAYVESVCFGNQFNVQSLDPGNEYSCPSGNNANACTCNTVTYSLLSACAACQNGTYVDWFAWVLNCSTTYVGYPESIPSGTAIPHWAYQDVTPDGNFNVTLAKAVGDRPETTATNASTTASLTPSPSSSTSSTSSPSTQESNNTGAIVGGVVGGVVGLVAAAIAIWYFAFRGGGKSQQTPSAIPVH